MIAVLLYSYFVIFPFGQLLRLSLKIPEINIQLADFAVGFLVLLWLVRKLIKREKNVFPSLSKQIFLFFFFASFSLALNSFGNLSGREMVVSWLYLLRWSFYAGLFFLSFDLLRKRKDFKLEMENGLIGVGLGCAILGLLQYFFLPDTRFLEVYGWDPHYYRLIGTFLDPGFLGIILVLTLILVAISYINTSSKKNWERKLLLILTAILVYVALALTYSRASYLAYLVAMGTIAWVKKRPKFFGGVLVAGIITVLLLPRPGGEGVRLERDSTIRLRLINWQQSTMVAKDHFLFGVGFNAYRYVQRDYGFLESANWRTSHAGGGADSSLLFVLATTGIFGLFTYLWFWQKILVHSLKTRNLLILASCVALLISSWFANTLFYPWIMAWFWILLGANTARE